MNPAFWRNKRVLLTGHTGFKGSWLALWLHRMGARVTGIALPPATAVSLYSLGRIDELMDSRICDIRDAAAVRSIVDHADPEIVLHLAAQPLVLEGYRRPLETLATNVQGTANVLDALRTQESTRVVVVVTTDKVYRNLEQGQPYREDDRLGGHDPYSASKAAAELVVSCWRDSFLSAREIGVASARAGNVVGGGDWSEDRLVPDAVRAWLNGDVLRVRRPDAVRPWQHVLDPLAGYLRLAECLWYDRTLAGAYNFGPPAHEATTVRQVVSLARQVFGRGDVEWGDGVGGPHEAGLLTLNTEKTQSVLGVLPRWELATSVRRTMEWYRRQFDGACARQLCEEDIAAFMQAVPLSGERVA
jgi:CDP-glucose 4,6-dehydratase